MTFFEQFRVVEFLNKFRIGEFLCIKKISRIKSNTELNLAINLLTEFDFDGLIS